MSTNEIILQYLLSASVYHQSYKAQLESALEIETNSFERFAHIFAGFAYYLLYQLNLQLAQSLGNASQAEGDMENALDTFQASMNLKDNPDPDGAYNAYKTAIENAFGIQISDVSFTPTGSYEKKLALTSYRKGLEDMAVWLKSTYCSSQSPCLVNRYIVFQSVIGKYTLVRTSSPETGFFYHIDTNGDGIQLYGVPRGYTQDHETFELYGSSRYLNISGVYQPAIQNDICGYFSGHCSNGVPTSLSYTAGLYQNAMGAGNLTHELAHILVNSSGFGEFDTSILFNGNLISAMSAILTSDQRYNSSGTQSEELANFIGASAVGDRPNGNNDGLVLTSTEYSALDTAAETSYLGLLLEAIKVNVLRNTPPDVIAKLINQTNPVSFDASVSNQVNLSSEPNLTSTMLPIPVRTNSHIKLLGRTNDSQWVYLAVGRPDNTTDIAWYDYGWLTALSVSPIGDITNLHSVSIDGVNPFTLTVTSQGGLAVGLAL